MISRSIAAAARRLELRCRQAIWESGAGSAATPLRGKGLEFAEVRPYQPGDESRDIDWKVTARRSTPYVKQFLEERQRTVWLVLDETASMRAGGGRSKREAAVEALAVLAIAAVEQDDRVGLLTFDSTVRPHRAGTGKNHVLGLFAKLLGEPEARARDSLTSVAPIVERLRRVAKSRSVVFVASDFLFENPIGPFVRVARRHELIALHIEGEWESSLPEIGAARMVDAETGRSRWVDTGAARVRRAFELAAMRRRRQIKSDLRRIGADSIHVGPEETGIEAVLRHFTGREARR